VPGYFCPEGTKNEHRTSNVQHRTLNEKKDIGIKLRRGATSLFDVQRWTFDVQSIRSLSPPQADQ
jgi:hypothetical protein